MRNYLWNMTEEIVSDFTNIELLSKNREKKLQRKQKRIQHLITKDCGVICCDEPTQVALTNFEYSQLIVF